MAADEIPLTRTGIAQLQQELTQLRDVRLHELEVELLALRESSTQVEHEDIAALEDAHQRLAAAQARIVEIERILERAAPIDEAAAEASDVIQPGSVVVVEHDGEERVYQLVGAPEAAPDEGKLSIDSPIGAALLGKRAGDEVTVQAPAGPQRLRIRELR